MKFLGEMIQTWNHVRTSGDKRFIGKTNAEAFGSGLAPQLLDGGFATLHHIGQDSRGPLAMELENMVEIFYTANLVKVNLTLVFLQIEKNSMQIQENWKFRVENK